MSSLSILAALMLSASPDSSSDNSMEHKVVAALNGNELGDGPVIELDVFGLSTGLNGTSVSFFGQSAGSGVLPLITVPSVMVGYEWDQMAALVGAQFFFTAGTGGQNGPIAIAIPVTFRRYLKPLEVYKFSPFIEGSFDMDFVVPAGGGLNFGFGVNAGFGGEYVFAHNFGLFGKALLGFQYIPSIINGLNTNTVAFGIGGVAGLLVHF
jgi:hypothetical protein